MFRACKQNYNCTGKILDLISNRSALYTRVLYKHYFAISDMCWLVPSALIVLLQVTSVYALQPSRCNRTIEETSYSSCASCHIHSLLPCPPGSFMVDTTGRFCTYIARVGWTRRRIPGCIHQCKRKTVHSECCPGFWGTDCRRKYFRHCVVKMYVIVDPTVLHVN